MNGTHYSDYAPALKYGAKIYPEDLANPLTFNGKYWYVDGDNGNDSLNSGRSIDKAFKTLAHATSVLGPADVILMKSLHMAAGATDPVSYTENAVIAAGNDRVSIIGINTGRVQGGLPQLKVGATTTSPILTVRAPGCLISGIGINGSGGTGGGILLDDDGSTKSAFGTTIVNSHFKNSKVTATDGRTGGAIYWGANGGAWQVRIAGNRFYKNVADVVLVGTSVSVPQDVIIEDNVFGDGDGASTDINLFLKGGGSGMLDVVVKGNSFTIQPALSTGQVKLFADMTGCKGLLANNFFGDSGTIATSFSATGSAAIIPTTVFMSGNYSETGLITR